MSLQSDLKGYADSAVEAAEAVLGRLQQNLAAAKGTDLEALRGTLEDFVASALVYTSKLSGRAESAISDLKSDPRLAQVIQTGEALATAVVGAVQERVGQAASTAASSAAGASAFVRSQAPGSGRAKPASQPRCARPSRSSKPRRRRRPLPRRRRLPRQPPLPRPPVKKDTKLRRRPNDAGDEGSGEEGTGQEGDRSRRRHPRRPRPRPLRRRPRQRRPLLTSSDRSGVP